MADKPTLEKFIKDPAFQQDRDLLEGFMTHVFEKKAEEARKKKEEEDKKNPKSFWDDFFGS